MGRPVTPRIEVQEKECCRCGNTKPASDFERDKRQVSGLFSWCKTCTREEFVARREARKALGVTVSSKICRDCGLDKPADAFAKNWGHSTGLQVRCKECRRIFGTLQKYNLTLEKYQTMLADQGGVCAICERTPDGPLQVDHDHSCCAYDGSCGQCVRGLICGSCNRAIGLMGDNADRLMSAAAYILTRGASAQLATGEIPSNEGVRAGSGR